MKFRTGDLVVYSKSKVSNRPGRRADAVRPAPYGEAYQYSVDKYWCVADVSPDGTLEVATRTGKTHRLQANDPKLRKATWFEKLVHRSRFPDQYVPKEEPEHAGEKARPNAS